MVFTLPPGQNLKCEAALEVRRSLPQALWQSQAHMSQSLVSILDISNIIVTIVSISSLFETIVKTWMLNTLHLSLHCQGRRSLCSLRSKPHQQDCRRPAQFTHCTYTQCTQCNNVHNVHNVHNPFPRDLPIWQLVNMEPGTGHRKTLQAQSRSPARSPPPPSKHFQFSLVSSQKTWCSSKIGQIEHFSIHQNRCLVTYAAKNFLLFFSWNIFYKISYSPNLFTPICKKN